MRDFFVLDTLDMVPKSDLATLEHPIYSLTTVPERRQLTYHHGECKIELIPSSLGLPTVFDKEIMIYGMSKLMQLINEGKDAGPVVRLTTHDMLVQTNRQTNNLGYERVLPALNRLRGVTINTTIATGDERTTHGFGLIDEFNYNRKGSMHAERLKYLELKFSDWVYRSVKSGEVLSISRDYFRLRSPIDRRVYEVARKHCGSQPTWRVGLELLQKKVGSKQAEKHFNAHMRGMVRSNHLPDYAVTVEDAQVVFYSRSGRVADGKLPSRRAVVLSRRPDGMTAQQSSCPAKSGDSGEAEPAIRKIRISSMAFDNARALAPGWDMYALENLYIDWASTKDAARSEDARFLGWFKSYTKGKPAP